MPDFYQEALDLFDYTRTLRRDFHRHPELSFQEVRTAGIVAKELNELGLEVTTGVAKTGVVAMLEGGKPGPVVLVRFDMDALPVTEETSLEFASENEGVMHACGHDGHTSIGLTVARILNQHREDLAGSIKFVFQPAEEGLGGAALMVKEGVLQNPSPDYSLALHLWNNMPVGEFGITPGPAMAAAEEFKLLITGKGGHGASPHEAVDPVLASAQIVTALQSIVARNVPPLESAVVSVTAIRGGEAFNVIPPRVEMLGTIRTYKSEVREVVIARFKDIVNGVSSAMGCRAEIELNAVAPAVVNHAGLSERIRNVATSLFPDAPVKDDVRTMGSEDMAYMMQDVPACYFFVGSKNSEKGCDAPHHHPKFTVDEDALPRAVALMAASVAELLQLS